MTELRRVCVFCASSPGNRTDVTERTVELGHLLVERNIELVYGGGAVGLMGLIADTVMDAGGTVTGVIPRGLFSREVGHPGLTRLESVATMHERKARMYELADAFIALPGGFGTLEELAETLTWNQIGLLNKPVAVLDVDGFWQPLLELLDGMVAGGVLREKNRPLLIDDHDPHRLLDRLAAANHAASWRGEQLS